MGINKHLAIKAIAMSVSMITLAAIMSSDHFLSEPAAAQVMRNVDPTCADVSQVGDEQEEIDVSLWKSSPREVDLKLFGDPVFGDPDDPCIYPTFSLDVHNALSPLMNQLRCTLIFGDERLRLQDIEWSNVRGGTEFHCGFRGSKISAVAIQAGGICVQLSPPDGPRSTGDTFLVPITACETLQRLVMQAEKDCGIRQP